MYNAVSSLKGIIKLGKISIDNGVFQMHTKLTVLILAVFSVVVSTNQFFGDPIDCFTSQKDEFPGNVLDNFCWIHSTYVLPSAFDKEVGKEVISPGIDKHVDGDQKTYISYYQWVCFFLFFEAVLFYLPKFIWKSIEGKKIEQILLGLDCPIASDSGVRDANISKLAVYLNETHGYNTCYAWGFVVCEVLNFANVVGQIYFTNTFLGGEFTTYGTEVVKFTQMEQMNRTDPMIQVFPRVTKCTFHKYGPSGSIQNHDALCVLPINILNEKIFIFLWFWYIILSVTSGIALLYRLVLVIFPKVRLEVMYRKCRVVKKSVMEYVLIRLSGYGDWFVMALLEKNMNLLHYSQFITELHRVLSEENQTSGRKFSNEPKNSVTVPMMSDKEYLKRRDSGED